MELLLKLPRDSKMINQCKQDLLEQIAILHNQKSFRSVTVIADVDVV
jgi:primosomal protein N' (replication factor Y)